MDDVPRVVDLPAEPPQELFELGEKEREKKRKRLRE